MVASTRPKEGSRAAVAARGGDGGLVIGRPAARSAPAGAEARCGAVPPVS